MQICAKQQSSVRTTRSTLIALEIPRYLMISTIQEFQDTRLRMPNKWHVCREGQAGNKKRQSLVFSELPGLPSAGSRPGCFHTSLGCEPRSLIRVSLGCSIIQKNVRKDNPTPAYSPVSDRRRPTALVEVHWARRMQASMPQISGPNLQENHIIETCKEEGCAVSFIQQVTDLLSP
jgi:hypothetical protein